MLVVHKILFIHLFVYSFLLVMVCFYISNFFKLYVKVPISCQIYMLPICSKFSICFKYPNIYYLYSKINVSSLLLLFLVCTCLCSMFIDCFPSLFYYKISCLISKVVFIIVFNFTLLSQPSYVFLLLVMLVHYVLMPILNESYFMSRLITVCIFFSWYTTTVSKHVKILTFNTTRCKLLIFYMEMILKLKVPVYLKPYSQYSEETYLMLRIYHHKYNYAKLITARIMLIFVMITFFKCVQN